MIFPRLRQALRFPLLMLPVLLVLGLASLPAEAAGEENFENEPALTQADIDGYILLTPSLLGETARDPDAAGRLLAEAGLSRRRAVYVAAKIAVTQAMAVGALSPDQLDRERVPVYLRPSAEELRLVQQNLTSLTQAQIKARRAAAGQ